MLWIVPTGDTECPLHRRFHLSRECLMHGRTSVCISTPNASPIGATSVFPVRRYGVKNVLSIGAGASYPCEYKDTEASDRGVVFAWADQIRKACRQRWSCTGRRAGPELQGEWAETISKIRAPDLAARYLHLQPGQDLRLGFPGAQEDQPGDSPGRDLRPAGSQRGGEDYVHQ